MKTFVVLASLFSALSAFALDLSEKEIVSLYESGKTEEIAFHKVKLPASEKKKLLSKLEAVANDLSNIWPDTVLEGPYTQLGDAKLNPELVMGVFFKNELIGFVAEVHAVGAFNEECDYDFQLPEPEAEREHLKCLENFKGTLFEKFLTDKNGKHLDEFFEPADFVD